MQPLQIHVEARASAREEFRSVGFARPERDGYFAPQLGGTRAESYRYTIPLPLSGEIQLHSPILPRMVGRTVAGFDEDWKAGWRTPLAADFHFEMRVGAQSFGLYPPLAVWSETDGGWVLGPLAEDRARCSWSWGRDPDGRPQIVAQFDLWGQPEGVELPADYAGEGLFVRHLDPWPGLGPDVFSDYNQALKKRFYAKMRYARPTVESQLFWGSWNDGTFRDVDHDRLVGMAEFLRDRIPRCRWIQIDDGWAGPSSSIPGSLENRCESLAMSDFGYFYRYPYQEEDPRFPNGLAAVAKAIKKVGLRPMIWLTPTVMETSPLYAEKPEWFLQDARLHFWKEMRFLDFSLPEVRQYARRAFDIVFNEWGFEGCKLDFWTMGFDQDDVRLRRPDVTSVACAIWFLNTLRGFLEDDGVLMACTDLPFGSPFRAKAFNQFRYYSDSEGSCQNYDMMLEQALSAAVLVGLYNVQDFWIPDGDGLGLFDHFEMPENRYRLWCAFLLGSGTLTELAGWLHQKSGPRLELLRRVAAQARLGRKVTLPGYDWASVDRNPPQIWVRHDDVDIRMLALTNWSKDAKRFELSPDMLGLPVSQVRDIFTNEILPLSQAIEVGPEDGRAFTTDLDL